MNEAYYFSIISGAIGVSGTLATIWFAEWLKRRDRREIDAIALKRDSRRERLAAGKRVFEPLHYARMRAQEVVNRDLEFMRKRISPDDFRATGLIIDRNIFSGIDSTYFESNLHFPEAKPEFDLWTEAAYEAFPIRATLLEQAFAGKELSPIEIQAYELTAAKLIERCDLLCNRIIALCRLG